MNGAPTRLAIVLSHPVQYYSPWFRWLATRTDLTLRVFYLWEFGVTEQLDRQFGKSFRWDVDLLSGYDSEFVPNTAADPGTHHFTGLRNPELPARLAAWRPDALLLFGYAWRSHLAALRWACSRHIPVILRGDSHLLGRGLPSLPRRIVLRWLLRRFAAFACVGAANRAYYRALGVPEDRLHFVPHCVDQDRFTATAELRRAAAELRGQLGLTDRRVVLFAGKFQPRKQPLELLRAFQETAGADDALVFVGDGPQLPDLQAQAAARPERRVIFLPFANQSEMPVRYLLADIFALPSRGAYETWGLAVNEAMHLGVPCLVSDAVGCQQDLVTDGETGWVFRNAEDAALPRALARALRTAADDLKKLGEQARQRAAGYSYASAARGLLSALAATGN